MGTFMANYIQEIRALVGHKPIILNAAGGILLNDRQQVLLNLRTDTHNWSLPGGYLEYGETYAQAMVREYKEDSGIDVKIVRSLGVFDKGETRYPNGDVTQVICQLYLVAAVGGHTLDQATDETLDLQYFDFDQLPPLLNDQTAEMLAAAKQQLV
ncbi:ADP-ribose pyrophosphatase [Levilactobacillus zymae]|uniref:ADP-ribose pyrophosphatase n=2 Tax=Levilactobacillus zymae TaxID=267363 RepID=A0A1Y6K2D7_9LACO|nr:NTP pyrophosphohydrolase [Levilactobacillus zymae DSM 19395]GEO72589.1 ADP-ribose pyrophosphatase [Levilactobacillus zymae]SMS15531.1 Phosphohydrolase (MutT/nudix family protein) [Levilactobacillus zymae]